MQDINNRENSIGVMWELFVLLLFYKSKTPLI